MLGALPGVTAWRLARRIDAVAGPAGMAAFGAACRVVPEAGALAAAPAAGLALVLVELRFAENLGRRDPGEAQEARFTARATLDLAGPEAVAAAGAEPAGTLPEGRDLMLAVALDALVSEGEGAAAADRAAWLTGGRRLQAWWRAAGIGAVAPGAGDRPAWQVAVTFEGALALSPDPAQGGPILRLLTEGTADGRHLAAGIEAPAERLPLGLFAGMEGARALRLAAEGLREAGDLLRLPPAGAAARFAAIAAGLPGLEAALAGLRATLALRRDLVAAGLRGAPLPADIAARPVHTVWDGATFTPPGGLGGGALLRLTLLGRPLVPLLAPAALGQVTLGQISTSDGGG